MLSGPSVESSNLKHSLPSTSSRSPLGLRLLEDFERFHRTLRRARVAEPFLGQLHALDSPSDALIADQPCSKHPVGRIICKLGESDGTHDQLSFLIDGLQLVARPNPSSSSLRSVSCSAPSLAEGKKPKPLLKGRKLVKALRMGYQEPHLRPPPFQGKRRMEMLALKRADRRTLEEDELLKEVAERRRRDRGLAPGLWLPSKSTAGSPLGPPLVNPDSVLEARSESTDLTGGLELASSTVPTSRLRSRTPPRMAPGPTTSQPWAPPAPAPAPAMQEITEERSKEVALLEEIAGRPKISGEDLQMASKLCAVVLQIPSTADPLPASTKASFATKPVPPELLLLLDIFSSNTADPTSFATALPPLLAALHHAGPYHLSSTTLETYLCEMISRATFSPDLALSVLSAMHSAFPTALIASCAHPVGLALLKQCYSDPATVVPADAFLRMLDQVEVVNPSYTAQAALAQRLLLSYNERLRLLNPLETAPLALKAIRTQTTGEVGKIHYHLRQQPPTTQRQGAWNALFDSYVLVKHFEAAWAVWDEMGRGVGRSPWTVVSYLRACADAKDLPRATETFEALRSSPEGAELLSYPVWNTYLQLFLRPFSLSDLERTLVKMKANPTTKTRSPETILTLLQIMDKVERQRIRAPPAGPPLKKGGAAQKRKATESMPTLRFKELVDLLAREFHDDIEGALEAYEEKGIRSSPDR